MGQANVSTERPLTMPAQDRTQADIPRQSTVVTFEVGRAVVADGASHEPRSPESLFQEAVNAGKARRKKVSYAFVKRAVDLLLASLALIIFSPLMLIIALAIKMTDRGPVFFCQERVGLEGRIFRCFKFRTMCVGAEKKRAELLHMNEASGPVFKIKKDPRVTRVGAVLRKLSLDELPQLLNVVCGDMSIVGPRPLPTIEIQMCEPEALGRLAVKPGITCTWQISGRSNIGFDEWVALDLNYIETMSFWLDAGIILRTVPVVIAGTGAH